MKNIANVFDKFKHQHKLFDGQQKEEEFNKTFSWIKRKNFEVPLERRTTMSFNSPPLNQPTSAANFSNSLTNTMTTAPKLRRFTTDAAMDL